MMPAIPKNISLEALVALHHWMIHKDPDHRYFTWLAVGHEPTGEELAQHWYKTGAHVRFKQALQAMVRQETLRVG